MDLLGKYLLLGIVSCFLSLLFIFIASDGGVWSSGGLNVSSFLFFCFSSLLFSFLMILIFYFYFDFDFLFFILIFLFFIFYFLFYFLF